MDALRRIGIALSIYLLLTTAALAGPEGPPSDVDYHPDLVFCHINNKLGLKLDLTCPKQGEGPFPTVVCIHGGGWVNGSHKTWVPLTWQLAQHGYVAASITHRLAPDHPFPAAIFDVKCAVRWLRANAGTYHIDPERIGAFGNSSGGTLACLLGMTGSRTELEGHGGNPQQSSQVAAVACYSSLMDLTTLYERCQKKEIPLRERTALQYCFWKTFGGSPDQVGEHYLQMSPATYAGKESAPTLLICGAKDRMVPLDQSRTVARKLQAAGVPVSLVTLDNTPHDFSPEQEKIANAKTMEFFDRYLKRPAPK